MRTACALLLAAGIAATTASAQSFTLIETQNFDLLMDDPSGNDSFWIGNNPSAIAFDGVNLYIGGFCNGTCPWVQVVKVENVLGTRQFRALIDQSDPLNPNQDPNISSRRVPGNSRGITGLDYVPGAGLVMTCDLGGFGPAGQVMAWDVETQQNPIPLASSQSGESPRGVAGPSWDLGFDGAGFTWDLGGGDTGTDDPVVAVLDFTSDPRGPLGLSPNTLSGAFGATVYEVDTGGPRIDGGDLSGTIWRDIDIDPNTGNIAARAANDLVIARRAADNTVASKVVVDGGDHPFVVGQNVNILHGLCTGDLVVYNSRPDSGTQSFDAAIRFVDLDGDTVSVGFSNADGSTFVGPDSVGYYDFAWDEASGTLAIMDFGTRDVYFFQADCDDDPCAYADFNGDGDVNTQDVLAFLNAWNNQDPSSDCNEDGTVNTQDVLCFLNVWNSCR